MRLSWAARILVLSVGVALLAFGSRGAPALAARHHFYVGTITQISEKSITIHSKTHNANYTFVIDGSTRFLRHGQAVARNLFKVGSYVTVSYSSGPRNSMIAYHISLRR